MNARETYSSIIQHTSICLEQKHDLITHLYEDAQYEGLQNSFLCAVKVPYKNTLKDILEIVSYMTDEEFVAFEEDLAELVEMYD